MSSKDEEPIQLTDDDHIDRDEDLLAKAIPIDQIAGRDEDEITSRNEDGLEVMNLIEDDPVAHKPTIQVSGRAGKHEDKWNRTPNVTGHGAIHVKTFVAKLRLDAIDNMDQNINEWLDAHPQYEVKMVTSNVGELVGKTKEQALFVSIWV